jgi:hypothetical protein
VKFEKLTTKSAILKIPSGFSPHIKTRFCLELNRKYYFYENGIGKK